MFKQVKFVDEEHNILGGFAFFDEHDNIEYIVCGCCGSMLEPDEVTIVEVYHYWANISDEIIGE